MMDWPNEDAPVPVPIRERQGPSVPTLNDLPLAAEPWADLVLPERGETEQRLFIAFDQGSADPDRRTRNASAPELEP